MVRVAWETSSVDYFSSLFSMKSLKITDVNPLKGNVTVLSVFVLPKKLMTLGEAVCLFTK